jgi:hypothetical protein
MGQGPADGTLRIGQSRRRDGQKDVGVVGKLYFEIAAAIG